MEGEIQAEKNEVVNQTHSYFPCSEKLVECLREKEQDVEREAGREETHIETKEKVVLLYFS